MASECEPGEGQHQVQSYPPSEQDNGGSKLMDFVPKGMKHSDFKIGTEFLTETGRWRCTDVGKRTIAAIKLDHDDDPAWYNGPPYAVVEHVFDEFSIEGLSPAPRRRTYDDSGRSTIVTIRTTKVRSAKILKKLSK